MLSAGPSFHILYTLRRDFHTSDFHKPPSGRPRLLEGTLREPDPHEVPLMAVELLLKREVQCKSGMIGTNLARPPFAHPERSNPYILKKSTLGRTFQNSGAAGISTSIVEPRYFCFALAKTSSTSFCNGFMSSYSGKLDKRYLPPSLGTCSSL